MRKKLMFLVATALLVVNVIYLVKAENCDQDADCVEETADSGYVVKCVYGVCKVVADGGGGTLQQGKQQASKTETTTSYGEVNAQGSWVVLTVGGKGGYSRTTTVAYACCKVGGNNCSTNYQDCD
jgi:hypothetical protein